MAKQGPEAIWRCHGDGQPCYARSNCPKRRQRISAGIWGKRMRGTLKWVPCSTLHRQADALRPVIDEGSDHLTCYKQNGLKGCGVTEQIDADCGRRGMSRYYLTTQLHFNTIHVSSLSTNTICLQYSATVVLHSSSSMFDITFLVVGGAPSLHHATYVQLSSCSSRPVQACTSDCLS